MLYEERKVEYSPEWKGPLKNRSCTDWPCLAIFLVFMACWAGVGFYAISYGDIQTLLAPVDSEGRKCGIDDEVANASHLVFFDLTECLNTGRKCHTPQVCRAKCPTTNWYYEWALLGKVETMRKNMICETGTVVSDKEKPELEELILANKCAKWYLNSTSIVGRCIPQSVPYAFLNVTLTESQLEDAQKIITGSLLSTALPWGGEILDAAIASRSTIFVMIAGGAALCIIYLILSRWLALPFFFLSAAILCGFFSYLSYFFYQGYDREHEFEWLIPSIIFGILAGCIVLIIVCLLDSIRLACQLIKEASKAVVTIYSSLAFPVLPVLLHLAALVYLIVTGLYLSTIKTLESWQFKLLITVHVVGFMWFCCFITAFGLIVYLEMFLKFMNRNAYIVCAIYGKGLWNSALDAISLILRNADQAIVLNNVVFCVLLLGKLLIIVPMGLLAWLHFAEMKDGWALVVLVVIGAYCVSSAFFSAYEVAIDTIFLCFLEDCEHHDGSPSRPYYMSRQLRKLLHKDL